MAMMDNSGFLISHIRNSFITSDDTGMCELVIDLDDINEKFNPAAHPPTWHGSQEDEDLTDSGLESDIELAHSMDIVPDMDFTAHRHRSNTAQRLDKLKLEKHKHSKIKHIQWREMVGGLGDEDVSDTFEKKEMRTSTVRDSKRKSALSLQLETFASCPNNPFTEYARYDGKATPNVPTKKVGIFLTMAPEDERSYPMMVITLSTARVSDVIGLICWQYTVEQRQPPLREELEAFSLYMVEDDGEVDFEFPALDNKEPISKFGFSRLALVEKDIPKKQEPKSSIVVTINLPERGFSKLVMDSDTILLKEVLDKVLQKRKLIQDSRRRYILERQSEHGVAVDLDMPLSALDTLEFCLVRANSTRGLPKEEDIPGTMSAMAESLSSHQYRSYIVVIVHKLRTYEVQLGISGEKIEIDPVSGKGKLFVRPKAATYDMDRIADCVIIETKSSGKATFRLVYQGSHGDSRSHDFESDIYTAQEIVKKISHILEMRSSPFRKDHLEKRRRNFSKKRPSFGK